jgi:16S rRNA (guanine527-N7)-methyltransferase
MSRAGAGCGCKGARGIELGLAAGGPERYHCPSVAAKLGPLVDRAAGALGAPVDARARDAIERWLERLVQWNARIDLTAARTDSELVDLMVADSALMSTRIARGARVVDVGTGAGAPGLALALLRPDLGVTLVEPRSKRTSFLRTVLGELDLTDIVIERKRGDALSGRRDWDVAISRATLEPSDWLELGSRLVRSGGEVWVLLAKDPPPKSPHPIAMDHEYVWPLTGVARRAVTYRIA